jgi:sugar lactone lactonase YvrE
MFIPPSLLCDSKCFLGESPLWDPRTNTFYWVDILGDALHSMVCTSSKTIPMPFLTYKLPAGSAPGFCALTSKPNVLLVGTKEGLFYFSWSLEVLSPSLLTASQESQLLLKGTPPDGIAFRFNDSQVCSVDGSLYAGIAQVDEERLPGRGALFNLQPSAVLFEGADAAPWEGLPSGISSIRLVRPSTTVSNGFGWPTLMAPSSRLFVHIDSPTRCIAVIRDGPGDYPAVSPLVDTKPWGGYPDGMTMDSRNHAYVACIFAGVVAVTTPLTNLLLPHTDTEGGAVSAQEGGPSSGGDVLRGLITLPVPLVTSCCIGGPDMNQLFMTTARGVTPEAAAENACDSGEGGIFLSQLPDTDVGVVSPIWASSH